MCLSIDMRMKGLAHLQVDINCILLLLFRQMSTLEKSEKNVSANISLFLVFIDYSLILSHTYSILTYSSLFRIQHERDVDISTYF